MASLRLALAVTAAGWAVGVSTVLAEETQARISLAIAQLSSQEAQVKAEACRTLQQLQARDSTYFIQKALDDSRPEVRGPCLSALAWLSGPGEQPVELYYQAIRDKAEVVRAAAAGGLGRLDPMPDKAIHEIIELLDRETAAAVKDRSMLCNSACVTAEAILKRVNTPEAQAALRREVEAFRSIPPLIEADQNKRAAEYRAEVAADADKISFLSNIPWIALILIATVIIVSMSLRIGRRHKNPSSKR